MEVRINGKVATLKHGTSFEYIAENRMFTGSDGYTLTINFPLKGCAENIAIFGHINRADVSVEDVTFDCEIRDRGFYKFGSLTITEVDETEVKAQFLEGRSAQNFDKTFDNLYINQLALGVPENLSPSGITPAQAWNPGTTPVAVALPWVNNNSESGNMQNKAEYAETGQNTGTYYWNEETERLSWQPYLIFIARQIAADSKIQYSTDFTEWEAVDNLKYLLVCNTLPAAWDMPYYAAALPHWTVEEFFSKLELLLGGYFDIDHRNKKITFHRYQNDVDNVPPVEIADVVDEHSTQISKDDEDCSYLGCKNLAYKESDNPMSKFMDCGWILDYWKSQIVSYATLSALLQANKHLAKWHGDHPENLERILYAQDVDAYFIIRVVGQGSEPTVVDGKILEIRYYKTRLLRINMLAGSHSGDEDKDKTEIEFIPAYIDDTEDKYGNCLFLSFSSFEDNGIEDNENADAYQTHVFDLIKAGKKDNVAEFYSDIYIGYWNGQIQQQGLLPFPNVDNIYIYNDWSNYKLLDFSLRLDGKEATATKGVMNINGSQKTTFKFISDNIPNPRAVFYIRNKRYLCEKLTATFSENGMSRLIKGDFREIVD